MTMMPRIPLPDGNFTFEWDGGQPDITCDGPMTTYAFLPVDIKRGETIQIRIHRDTVSHCVDLLDPYTPIEMEHISVSYLGENEAGESQFSYHNKDTGVSEKISTSLMAYDSFQNTSEHVSGAYIFRPEHEDGQAYSFRNEITKRELFCGKNVCILLMFGDTVINNIIFNNFNDFIRLETVFMGIPYSEQGKEVVMRIRAESIQNDGVFYTDSMGLELQKRVVNERPYWNLDVNEPVAGNYYPVNNLIRITDNNTALEVINDRPQGGTSLKDGEIELMVQRRLYVDDEKGVNEPLNESDDGTPEGPGAKVKLYTYFRITTPNPPEPISIAKVDLESPAVEIFDFSPSEEPPRRFTSTKWSYPRELKILSFPEGNGTVFFRIENILEKKIRDETFRVDATKIAQELSNLEIDSLVETSLTGVFTIDELQSRLKWEGEDFTSPRTDYSSDLSNITLEPQRIRSFRVKFKKPSVVSFSF